MKNTSQLGKAITNVISYGTALSLVRRIYTQLISTIKEMDQALTDMTVVTSLTREQAWELTGTLQDLAKQTGMTATTIADMTTKYLQQGKTLDDALTLTEAAAKAARIAGISGSQSIDLLTNAMNGFQVSASKAMEVSDKFAALAAAAATDYEELATALSKVAAQANLAGMSMDFTLGMLTKGIEVTREAPETIGTALKTVIARMRELTDYGATLDDGLDVNRVAKALDNIGVSLMDENNEFRDLDDVLTEVGLKWDTLNKNQQANVAVALAGTRQQSRLIAMLQDFDRTQQLVNISMDSAGATAAQHRKYMQGLEAATTQLTTAYQQLITTFTNSDFAISAVNGLTSALEWLSENIGVVKAAIVGLAGLGIYSGLQKIAEGLGLTSGSILAFIADTNAARDASNQETAATIRRNAAIGQIQLQLQSKKIAELQDTLAMQENTLALAQNTAEIQKQKLEAIQLRKEKSNNLAQTIKLRMAERQKVLEAKKNLTVEQRQLLIEAQAADQKKLNRIAILDQTFAEEEHTRVGLIDAATTQAQTTASEMLNTQKALEAAQAEKNAAATAVELGVNAQNLTLTQAQNLESERQVIISKLKSQGYTEEAATEAAANIIKTKAIILGSLDILMSKTATKEEKKEAAAKATSALMSAFKAKMDNIATGATAKLTIATKLLTTTIYNVPIIGWILAIIALVVALVKAVKQSGAFADAWQSLKDIFSGVFDIIKLVFDIITDLIVDALGPTIARIRILLAIGKVVIAIVEAILNIIKGLVQAFKNLLK